MQSHKIEVAENIMEILQNFQIFHLHAAYFSQLFKNDQFSKIENKLSHLKEHQKYEIFDTIVKDDGCKSGECFYWLQFI